VSQRNRILQVALHRFARHGIAATTIQDVADHAEVSKASVLYHFSSKAELKDHALTPSLDAPENVISGMEDHTPGSAGKREGS
jgi:Transcriptional regulator